MELTEGRKRRHDRMYQGQYQAPVKSGRKRPAGHVIEKQNKNRAKNVAQRVELKSRAMTTPSAPRAAQQIESNHMHSHRDRVPGRLEAVEAERAFQARHNDASDTSSTASCCRLPGEKEWSSRGRGSCTQNCTKRRPSRDGEHPKALRAQRRHRPRRWWRRSWEG